MPRLDDHLAQRPGSYVVIKYRRPVVKIKSSQTLVCAAAPAGVIDGSRADVSFVAVLLIDKFAYHLPLYRQHQRLTDAGITVTRPWLTQVAQQGVALLEAIDEAQFASIRESRVKAMDESPIKAGQAGPGQLKKTYFWPVYGELDEIGFHQEHTVTRKGTTSIAAALQRYYNAIMCNTPEICHVDDTHQQRTSHHPQADSRCPQSGTGLHCGLRRQSRWRCGDSQGWRLFEPSARPFRCSSWQG